MTEYDCIDHEWEEWCSVCGRTFTNQGHAGIDCPHCVEADEKIDERNDD